MIVYNGASGGLGSYLAPALRDRSLSGAPLRSRLEDRAGLRRELAELSVPDQARDALLLQLAARVSVPACETDPEGARLTNVTHVLETVLEFATWAQSRGLRPRVLYVSSGHVYAASAAGVRIGEDAPTAPRSAYARTKFLAEQELRESAERRGFQLLVARVFGLVAPRQPAQYLLPGLLRRVRNRDVRGIPGLSYVRDYLDARDVCDALVALGAAGARSPWRHRVVNVCSGEGVALREVLRAVVKAVRPDEEETLMRAASEAPGRPDDVPWIVGDPSLFVNITSERPRKTSLAETIDDAVAAD
jgi:GDP-4-dehydro-6-deoxy-D-mannose reductase